jgi:hypothetical protein
MRLKSYTLLKETTKWASEVGNGIYIVDEKPGKRSFKALGFISHNTDEVKWLKSGLTIDMKNRTFKIL